MILDGLLVLDKPAGITSRDAVDRAARWLPRRTKLGHTGTLDPLATGVLVLCVGAATRLAEYVQAMSKTYESRFLLGATSDTDDLDGRITSGDVTVVPTRNQIEVALGAFVGEIEQVPPAYSAAKVSGARAYDLARSGTDVQLAARRVRVDRIDVIAYEYPYLDVRIDCGKGTYIRSLARDLGAELGCGGLVATLRRTRVGPFRAEDGISPIEDKPDIRTRLRSMSEAVAELTSVRVSQEQAMRIRNGQTTRVVANVVGEVAVLDDAGGLVAIARRSDDSVIRPVKVIPSSRDS